MINKWLLLTAVLLTGCNATLPSFWDDNQSAAIINVRQTINELDCDTNYVLQVYVIKKQIEWFDLYSESKGSRQQDVRDLIAPMMETVENFYIRSISEKPGGTFYCNSKKEILQEQSSTAAKAIMRRF